MRVLSTPPYFRPVPDKYVSVFRRFGIEIDNPFVAQNMTESELLPIIDQYDGVIAGDDDYTAKVIEKGAASRLKVIVKWGVGINAIDQEAAARLGVAVRRSPGALSDAVADQAWGYILMLARQLHVSDAWVREGKWEKIGGVGLRGRTLGIIGVGHIGKQVALRARPFGMKVVGHDIVPMDQAFLHYSGIRMSDKATVLREADFVVLACDLNPTSFHVVGAPELALMKPSAFLINVSRGALVDNAAAADALLGGRIRGSAFDVYEVEPLPEGSPLRRCPNTLLNAHNAFNSDTAVEFVNDNTVRELLSVLKPGEPVVF